MRREISRKEPVGSFWFVWRMPLLMAVVTASGLLAALLGAGSWRVLAWVALALPLVIGAWFAIWSNDADGPKPDSSRLSRRK